MTHEFLNAFAAQWMDQRGIARERLTYVYSLPHPECNGIAVGVGNETEIKWITLSTWMATDEQCALVSKALEALFPQPKPSLLTVARARFAARRAPLSCRHWTGAM